MDRVYGAWTGGTSRVHGGPEAVRTKCVVVRCWREASERSGSPVLIRDGRGGRGRCGEADSELTGARAMTVRRRDGGGRWWRKELITQALESGSELKKEGERCGGGQGSWSPFIGVEGAPGRGGND
jgi:hypothetical protein